MTEDTTTELRHGYAELDSVRLHYVEAGQGPLVVLLHGFPEFWYGWRAQIGPLATAGFRVVAPDMRGYNLSGKPTRVQSYRIGSLTADVRDLIAERGGADGAMLVGHDWGGAVAWATAIRHPEAVNRLAILNVPHPRRMLEGLRTARQLRRSWYMLFVQLPGVSERLLRARRFRALRRPFSDARPGSYDEADIDRYVEAWSQPGALTAMLNYYRAMLRRPGGTARASGMRPVAAPTLIVWGERDRHLGGELAEPHPADAPNLERVVRIPNASHWVAQDEPELVNRLLAEFFVADRR
ncbi:MAG TPA: alpha/beta hydrolase [Solirubrobacteraceae bacterium]|nr:alpha/beta hydrolase [Solirubrobacteraceae bacterium]